MKEDFDIEELGKRLPYNVPAGFFEKFAQSTLQEARRAAQEPKRHFLFPWKPLSVAASVAVILMAAAFYLFKLQSPPQTVAQVVSQELPAPTPTVVPLPVPKATVAEKVTHLPARGPVTVAAAKAATPPAPPSPTVLPEKEETLHDLLASVTDEELAQLAAMAESEEYVYGETLPE